MCGPHDVIRDAPDFGRGLHILDEGFLDEAGTASFSGCDAGGGARGRYVLRNFVSDGEAARCGWKEPVENELLRKMGKIRMPSSGSSSCSEETSSGSFYSGISSSSTSLYSCGSSSSAFESSSSRRSSPVLVLITPPAKAVDVFHTIEKAPSRLELGLRAAVAQYLIWLILISAIYLDIVMLDGHIYGDITYAILECGPSWTLFTIHQDIKLTTLIITHNFLYDPDSRIQK